MAIDFVLVMGPALSLEILHDAIISSRYESPPMDPAPPRNDLSWTMYPALSPTSKTLPPIPQPPPPRVPTIPGKATPQVLTMFSPHMLLSPYLMHRGNRMVSCTFPLDLHVYSFNKLDTNSTGAFNDRYRKIQSSILLSFEPPDIASTIPGTPRRYAQEPSQPSQVEFTGPPTSQTDSHLSSMSPSSSSYSHQRYFSRPSTFQPTDGVLTPGNTSKSLASLGLWSTDVYLDGINSRMCPANNFQDETVEDFHILNRIQGETDTIWDHCGASGIVGGGHDGMALSTISASIVSGTMIYSSLQDSAFDQ
ncbi:hypothetical protein EDD18DRAFT_1360948 [Armillaria luteobubalina]|uniref:Uncharacterized protein n=1 Tax=Armillaria luteobubalina TaxID=153913 RepID=A0AA39PKD6_9AGAR|nr:hypothetical protein EDD18DRAFT_1360948 [Armillaria luteobubalina]